MITYDDIELLKQRRICWQCIGEEYLRDEVQRSGKHRKCFYCGQTGCSYSIEETAERVEKAFEEHYTRTVGEPDALQSMMLSDRESTYEWSREGEPTIYAIMDAARIPEAAASDIQKVLEYKHGDFESDAIGIETEFASDAYYEVRGVDDGQWQAEWGEFEHSLKTQARFFSHAASKHLALVFAGLESMKTYNGRPVIVSAGPGTKMPELYRARVFQSGDRLEEALAYPDRHLGPPPPAAAIAGRMNARGISVFYGATDPMVALAEVRPPVGSSVVVARFEVFRPLKLLDLIAMRDVAAHGSVFDAGFKRRREHSVFLGNLSDRIVRPVMPDDEPFEYLATQAIADFLATENAPALDGIIYPSVQAASNEARNVVLFHKAAIVEPMDLPENLEISVSSGHWSAEGWEADYSVLEEDRTGKEPRDHRSGLRGYYRGGRFGRADSERVIGWPAVRVDLQKINVHIVARVQFKTEDFKVSRSRHDRSEIPF